MSEHDRQHAGLIAGLIVLCVFSIVGALILVAAPKQEPAKAVKKTGETDEEFERRRLGGTLSEMMDVEKAREDARERRQTILIICITLVVLVVLGMMFYFLSRPRGRRRRRYHDDQPPPLDLD